MLRNFNLLRNIGQFDNVSAGAQLNLDQFNVVYAENGRGKTTLAAILRSLKTGNPNVVVERRRLQATQPPEVVIETTITPRPVRFSNGQWTSTLDQIEVFDDDFISKNVYSGLNVDAGHRSSLHELILGAQGVALNNTFQTHVGEIEDHNAQIRQKEAAIPNQIRGTLSVDSFCALPEIADIDSRITSAEQALAAARSSTVILKQSNFSPIELPKFDPTRLNTLLRRNLVEIDSAAESQVKQHLSKLGPGGEEWVAEGISKIDRVRDEREVDKEICPFCTQDLSGSSIIEHYRAYFSANYEALKREISAEINSIQETHNDEAPTRIERAITRALQNLAFWQTYIVIPEIHFDAEPLIEAWTRAKRYVSEALREKRSAPLELYQLSTDAVAAIGEYDNLCDRLSEFSHSLQELNPAISQLKETVSNANVSTLENELQRLRLTRLRYNAEVSPLCQDVLDEKAAKARTEANRESARAALDRYRQNIFPTYQTTINNYLARFNAGFRIGDVTSINNRGGSTCSYSVVINNTNVALEGGPGQPSFKTTLSAGDRNTLALAFFFASLEQSQNLAGKIVIIDDPMTSLDDHRTLATIQEINQLATRVSQLTVMSHSKPFLLHLWNEAQRTNKVAIKIVRQPIGSTFDRWNVTADSITEHDRRYELVHAYINQGSQASDERAVAAALRPMLEGYIRVAYPTEFPAGSLLGPFLHKCQQRLGRQNQILTQQDITELQHLLDYGNRFHHDTNPAYLTQHINDQELLSFCQRTIAFISG
jgi:wobble nucleotide-excising tRNase